MNRVVFLLVCGVSVVALVACSPPRRGGGGGSGGGGGAAAGGGGAAGGGNGAQGGGGGGGGAQGGGGGIAGEVVEIDSGVDESLQLKDMIDDDIEALCDKAAAAGREIFEDMDQQAFQHASCLFGGVFAEAFGGQCQAAYDECMGQPFDFTEEPCDITRDKIEDCEATVEQAELCIGSMVGAGAAINAALAEAFGGKTCRQAAELLEEGQEGEDPEGRADNLTPECQVIEDQCPGINDDDPTPEGGDMGGAQGGPEFDG